MQRERISDNVYWFQSEIYALVTSGVVMGTDWAVIIDTLAIPEEALEIRAFVEEELQVPIRYVINTHHHADHTWGNCFFPGATIIAHSLCRQYMIELEQKALEAAQRQNQVFKQTKIVLPHLTFSRGSLSLQVGKKHLNLFPTPGNSKDGISVLVEEDRILFAGDVFMPIPFIVDGDSDEMVTSLQSINAMGLENLVQGHGDVILRGEIDEAVKGNLNYLTSLTRSVKTAMKRKHPTDVLDSIDIESCGKSKVLLGGLAEELHRRNVYALYRKLNPDTEEGS
jgi:cyclase